MLVWGPGWDGLNQFELPNNEFFASNIADVSSKISLGFKVSREENMERLYEILDFDVEIYMQSRIIAVCNLETWIVKFDQTLDNWNETGRAEKFVREERVERFKFYIILQMSTCLYCPLFILSRVGI